MTCGQFPQPTTKRSHPPLKWQPPVIGFMSCIVQTIGTAVGIVPKNVG
jgi:hypothetical protein